MQALAGSPSCAILGHLRRSGWTTPATLSRQLGLHEATVRRHLDLLHGEGQVERRRANGGSRGYEYVVKDRRWEVGLVHPEAPVDEVEFYLKVLRRFLLRSVRFARKPLWEEFLHRASAGSRVPPPHPSPAHGPSFTEGIVRAELELGEMGAAEARRYLSLAYDVAAGHLGEVAARMVLVSVAREVSGGKDGVDGVRMLRGVVEV